MLWPGTRRSQGTTGSSLPAAGAVEGAPEHARSALRRQDPRAFLPRRIMPHVLSVAALEIRHPVALQILVKADDPPAHVSSFRSILPRTRRPELYSRLRFRG